MMRMLYGGLRASLLLIGSVLLLPTPGTAQGPPQSGNSFLDRFSGNITVSNELYDANGIEARRPGSTWRIQAAPSLRLFGATSVGIDLLLSNEGADFRQRLPQFGLAPRFGWGSVQLGDFSKDYSAYTLQGLRLRGAGVELTRGKVRASVQGGTSQNAIQTTPNGPVFQRTIVAGTVGIGKSDANSLDLTLVRALDALQASEPPLIDTLGLDTLAIDLRPQAFTRPQSGLTAALAGTAAFFGSTLKLKGELAGALLTRDRTSPLLNSDSLVGGSVISAVGSEVRLSSAADLAWNAEAQYRGRTLGLRAGIEQVGAGYGSLGVAYLINDRRALFAAGDIRLFSGALQLNGRVQQQNDNLIGQKRFTTNRDLLQAGLIARLGRGNLAVTGVRNLASNDATNDTLLVDNLATVLNAQASYPFRLGSRDLTLTLGGSWQQNEDANPVRAIPAITVKTWQAGLTVPVGPVTLSPSVNGVQSSGGGTDAQRNITGGFRANARFGKGNLGASYNRTFVAAREVTGASAQLSLPLPADVRLQFSARHQRYGVLGTRPAFQESFLSTTMSRSF